MLIEHNTDHGCVGQCTSKDSRSCPFHEGEWNICSATGNEISEPIEVSDERWEAGDYRNIGLDMVPEWCPLLHENGGQVVVKGIRADADT